MYSNKWVKKTINKYHWTKEHYQTSMAFEDLIENHGRDEDSDRDYADWCLGNNWLRFDPNAANFVMGEGWDDDEYEAWVVDQLWIKFGNVEELN